jgi:uncharacterized YceG family protein
MSRGGMRRISSRGQIAIVVALTALVVVVAWGIHRARAKPAAPAAPTPVQVVIPEGWRREQIAALLGQKTHISPSEYLAQTAIGAEGQMLAGLTTPRSLEGFLFPATYPVFPTTTAAQFVAQQVTAYRQYTSAVDYSQAAKKNLTRYDVLTIASMIEREVEVPAERAIVAGVIYNRLHLHMTLGIDATVQYALGYWKPNLTESDLQINSPYNTRLYPGLPPGPISNPGLASIQAAAHPAHVPYLYYVARNDGSGRHYFATTAAQFTADVAKSQANLAGG